MSSSRRFASKHIAGALALGALLLASGCGGRIALGASRRAQVRSVKTIAGLSQRTLEVNVARSRTGVVMGAVALGVLGGKVGDAVDLADYRQRREAAQATIRSIADGLAGYDLSAAVNAALFKQLAPLAWLKGNTVEVHQIADPASPQELTNLVKKSGADEVLLVQFDCVLTPALEALVVTAKVSLLSSRVGTVREGPARLYFNTLSTSVSFLGWRLAMAREEALALWAAGGSQSARRALDDSIEEIGRMIAFDLQEDSEGPSDAWLMKGLDDDGSETNLGRIVHKNGDRNWIRLSTGELYSVPSSGTEYFPSVVRERDLRGRM